MAPRRAGQHARETARRKAGFWLLVMTAMIAGVLALVVLGDLSWAAIVAVELVFIGGVLLIERFAAPRVERWSRGATGEEHVGGLLEGLEADGWLCLHDVDTGRGNIDSVVVGPGGLFTVEVKSHRGSYRPERLDPRWLSQAYAQSKWLEGVAGRTADPLLVFSHAFLVGRPVSRQRGVLVLPARMLERHLRRRRTVLSAEEVTELHQRLGHALTPAPA